MARPTDPEALTLQLGQFIFYILTAFAFISGFTEEVARQVFAFSASFLDCRNGRPQNDTTGYAW